MKTSQPVIHVETPESDWKGLIRAGGAAALAAGILFRRNIAAEIGLFNQSAPPVTVSDWFGLLQSNRLLGLVYLNIFDVVNYALVGLMFLALFAVLKRVNFSCVTIAAAFGFLGIAVYFSTNTAFSMLPLSDQYASATTEAERAMLLAAGQALLAVNRFTNPGAHAGAGGLLSLMLIAAASMMISIVMLQSAVFNRATTYVGILASTLDLAYCMAYAFIPSVDGKLLAVVFIPAAGLFWMIWHIMVGWKLYRLGKRNAG